MQRGRAFGPASQPVSMSGSNYWTHARFAQLWLDQLMLAQLWLAQLWLAQL